MKLRTIDLAYIAVFAVLIAACSWISIPAVVPFTLQTFAVFLTVLLLGGKKGTLAILVYLLLGAVGAPVFAGFSGGLSTLFGSTGGYLVGFLIIPLLYWAIVKTPGQNLVLKIAVLVVGQILCLALGTAWFMVVYAANTGAVSLMTALGWCVIPYLIPDAVKLVLAVLLASRLHRHVKL